MTEPADLYAVDSLKAAAPWAADGTPADPHVQVVHARYPGSLPSEPGDPVDGSEIVCLLCGDAAERASIGLERLTGSAGMLVTVHCTGETNHARSGSDICPWLDGVDFLARLTTLVDAQFELDGPRRLPDPTTDAGEFVQRRVPRGSQ